MSSVWGRSPRATSSRAGPCAGRSDLGRGPSSRSPFYLQPTGWHPWAGLLSREVCGVAAGGTVAGCAGPDAGYNRPGIAVGVADETGTHERKDLVPEALQPLR